jgi:hypothetical protein
MFETLTFIPHDIGTAIATWSALIALWSLFAAGLLEASKENDGNGSA